MFELFVARRIYRNSDKEKRVSRPAVLIAMAGIAVGLMVMMLSVAIVVGFKKQVSSKVIGFGSDIQISNLEDVGSYETLPVMVSDSLLEALVADADIAHVQRYSTKPGIIKMDDAFQGIILKGLGQEYDTTFLQQHLQDGEIPQFTDTVSSNSVVLSRSLADKLNIKLGDRIYTYFFSDEIRARRLTVKGIYQTHLTDYDDAFVLTDLYTVNRLYGWKPLQVSGLEVQVRDYARLNAVTETWADALIRVQDSYGQRFLVRNIEQRHPQIFDWLNFLDTNVWLILMLMLGVAGFTMISGLLILILERTRMIGILKALGATNIHIRKVFLWLSLFLIGRGLLWGNAMALILYFVQTQFGIFKLDPETYYTDTVPMLLNVWTWLLLNAGTLLAAMLMLIGPSYLITRIYPADSMRYE